ncbi:MAG: response regulator [Magnetococcales bacterium]|nr:response regulator [Magnetococcales bacterium]
MWRRHSLAVPLVALLLMLAACTMMAGYVSIYPYLRDTLHKGAIAEAMNHAEQVEHQLANDLEELIHLSSFLSDSDGMRTALGALTHGYVDPLIREKRALIRLSAKVHGRLMILDRRAVVVFGEGPHGVVGHTFEAWGVEEALEGQRISTLERVDERHWSAFLMTPVFYKGRVVGVVVVEMPLSREWFGSFTQRFVISGLSGILGGSFAPDGWLPLSEDSIRHALLEKRVVMELDDALERGWRYSPLKVGDETFCLMVPVDMGTQHAILQEAQLKMGLYGVVIVTLILLLGVVLQRVFLRPLRRLARKSQVIGGLFAGMEGELLAQDKKPVKNELVRLDDSIEAAGMQLFTHLAHRQVMADDLERAIERAEKANAEKSRFLSNMSHEIRTPMNVIMGMGHLLSQTELSDRQWGYLDRINTFSRMLLGIINDILDFSKIEAGRLDLEQSVFSLDDVLKKLEILAAAMTRNKALDIRFETADTVPHRLIGDGLRLEQVLTNLLSNALKFTEEGEVVISVAVRHRAKNFVWLYFSVRDTGIGLTEAQQQKLFRAFLQGEITTARKQGGTGLGLAICRQLVGMMGGRIDVESVHGQGSHFYFTAAFFRPTPGGIPAVARRSRAAVWEERHPVRGGVTLDEIRGARVLLVEDQETNREMAKEILQRAGLVVEVVENGAEAVRVVGENGGGYDAVIMDVQMPVMDGLDATRAIRQHSGNRELPIIAMTANAFDADRQQALEAGLNDHLAKPINVGRLHATLCRWIKPGPRAISLPSLIDAPPQEDRLITNLLPDHLPGIDLRDAMERMEGDQALYARLLGGFCRKNLYMGREIRAALADDQLEQADRLVHRLKGAAGNLAANDLFVVCRDLEQAIRDDAPGRFPTLLNKLDLVLEPVMASGHLLERKRQAVADKPTYRPKEQVDSADRSAALRGEMRLLWIHLGGHNMQSRRDLERIQGRIGNESRYKEDLEALDSYLSRLDFRGARGPARRLAEKLGATLDKL